MTKRSMNLAQFRLTMGRVESDNLEGRHILPTLGKFPCIEKGAFAFDRRSSRPIKEVIS
jgi:hypothetical protein